MADRAFELDDSPQRPTDELRRIACYQRWVLAIVMAQAALWIGYLVLTLARGDSPREGLGLPVRFTFILGAVGGIFTFLLYWTIRGPFPAFVMGLGAVPPCFGLLVMIVANANAAEVLRTSGVRVGWFFGAFDGDIEDYEELDSDDAGW
jgi:hypothetical protein